MQTFLPYPSFKHSAKVLDDKRLGKQRVETYQILLALRNPAYGWQKHPTVKMWRGYEHALIDYGIAICNEWSSRGYKDTVKDKLVSIHSWKQTADKPRWSRSKKFHSSHRSNLLRKNPEHYLQFGWNELNDLPYVWPK